MALPKIDLPTFTMTLPSNDKSVTLRPFTVKEEKILLTAQESNQQIDMITGIASVVNNCLLDDIAIEDLAIVDLEYMFLQLRAKSVSNISSIRLKDNEDQQNRDFDIDLEKINIEKPEFVSNVVMINDTVGMTLRYPPVSLLLDVGEIGVQTSDVVFAHCVVNIFDENSVYERADTNQEELLEFVNNLSTSVVKSAEKFFNTVPVLSYEIKYTNDNDREVVYKLQGLNDFF